MSVRAARRVRVEGVVQGVGFRPFVYGLAARHGVAGFVRNDARGVEIEAEGVPPAVEAFIGNLTAEAPPVAAIDRVLVEPIVPRGYAVFEITASRDGEGVLPVAADLATCEACLREVLDATDRRHGYPFTNCTHCGPRFTIVRAVPYDRPNTSMAGFAMCAACREEYDDPQDRRFHAQPNACAACGPRLGLLDPAGAPLAGDPLAEARRRLAAGQTLAVKGIGGYHLACDATDAAAVLRLRARKGREAKPLAIMVPDLETAERLCEVSPAERAVLTSAARPITLLRARAGQEIAPAVAPGLARLGVMLPYSPLHHLLFRGEGKFPAALVLTSGNRSEEPIATDDRDALARLCGIADAFLVHDRQVEARCDDSVTRVIGGAEVPLRRSRGYAPYPVRLALEAPPLIACGAELKSTICVARGRYAFLSPHVGDLESYETYASYARMVDRMAALFRVAPVAVAHDLHPGYLSTRYAAELDPGLVRIAVQHHHAHVAACMAEHGLTGRVIGLAFDGTGYGTDGRIWGGEVLVAGYDGFERAGHLGYVPLPGGDRAVREPFRVALAHLARAGVPWGEDLAPVREASAAERRIVARQVAGGPNAPLASSVGRLFDAVASLVGLRHRVRYEAQAAIELEALTDPDARPPAERYPVAISDGTPAVLDPGPIVRGVVDDVRAATPPPVVAARFHATLAAAAVVLCQRARAATGLGRVVLSGGVFQNATLAVWTCRALEASGFRVFVHRLVPPNDGGLALGQAVVAAARLARVPTSTRSGGEGTAGG